MKIKSLLSLILLNFGLCIADCPDAYGSGLGTSGTCNYGSYGCEAVGSNTENAWCGLNISSSGSYKLAATTMKGYDYNDCNHVAEGWGSQWPNNRICSINGGPKNFQALLSNAYGSSSNPKCNSPVTYKDCSACNNSGAAQSYGSCLGFLCNNGLDCNACNSDFNTMGSSECKSVQGKLIAVNAGSNSSYFIG